MSFGKIHTQQSDAGHHPSYLEFALRTRPVRSPLSDCSQAALHRRFHLERALCPHWAQDGLLPMKQHWQRPPLAAAVAGQPVTLALLPPLLVAAAAEQPLTLALLLPLLLAPAVAEQPLTLALLLPLLLAPAVAEQPLTLALLLPLLLAPAVAEQPLVESHQSVAQRLHQESALRSP
ncbi:g38 [Coccomyxa elongata]